MRALLVGALLASALTGGCTRDCYDFHAQATLRFAYEGSNATLIEEFRDLGWTVSWEEGVSSLSFLLEREHAGTRYTGVVHPSGRERAGDVEVLALQGSLRGEATPQEIEEHLAPVVEPMAARFGATPEYGGGGRHCGSV